MQMRQELEAILYNREEQPYIYPEGDNVPQDSLRYAGSSTTSPSVPPVPSVSPEQAGPEPYPAPGGEKSGFNNANSTIHIFGDTATAFLGPEQRDATVAAVNDFTRISPPPAPSPSPSPETSPAQTVPSKKKELCKALDRPRLRYWGGMSACHTSDGRILSAECFRPGGFSLFKNRTKWERTYGYGSKQPCSGGKLSGDRQRRRGPNPAVSRFQLRRIRFLYSV